VTLLAFAADRRAAVDIDRIAAALLQKRRAAIDRYRYSTGKIAASRGCGTRWDRRTHGRPTVS